jgi:hypothetical protein
MGVIIGAVKIIPTRSQPSYSLLHVLLGGGEPNSACPVHVQCLYAFPGLGLAGPTCKVAGGGCGPEDLDLQWYCFVPTFIGNFGHLDLRSRLGRIGALQTNPLSPATPRPKLIFRYPTHPSRSFTDLQNSGDARMSCFHCQRRTPL